MLWKACSAAEHGSSGDASAGWQSTAAFLSDQALQRGLASTLPALPFSHAGAVVTGHSTHVGSSKALGLHEQTVLCNTLL